MQQPAKKDTLMFSSFDESELLKQIKETHNPDDYNQVDVKPFLYIIEDILHRATHTIDGVRKHADVDTLKANMILPATCFGILDVLAYDIYRISSDQDQIMQVGGGDEHSRTMALFNMLSSYSWDAKVVLALAAFVKNYGKFWLVSDLYTTNALAKSIAILEQWPAIIEHSDSQKSRLVELNNLIKTMLNVTECIFEFMELLSQYINSTDTPKLFNAIKAHDIPIAAYWTIRSIVVCATQIANLMGSFHEEYTLIREALELSTLAHKFSSIHSHLKKQLARCYEHIADKRQEEAFNRLHRLFETHQLDNLKILKELIYSEDDLQPLWNGSTKTRVNIEALRRKNVLLHISDLDLSHEELMILDHLYKESRIRPELEYEVVWLPIVDRSTPWNEANQKKFEQLQSMMAWYTVHHPSLLQPAVVRYIREVWHFQKKPILVTLDPQGKVACPDSLHMMWIWGNLAYPFTSLKEESLWTAETWRLELLVDGIDGAILDWITEGRFICLYGGEDTDWIRKFTSTSKAVAKVAGITIEMVYAGKKNTNERVRKNIAIINLEKLSHSWPDPTSIWFFWTRLESMLYSKLQHRKTTENDGVMQEVMTMLSFDGSDQGWAVFCKGSAEMARGKGDTILTSLLQFEMWEENAKQKGFVPALDDHLHKLHTPHHCNRLILPENINGGIPEMVVCAECSRPMEKYFMYRCCTE